MSHIGYLERIDKNKIQEGKNKFSNNIITIESNCILVLEDKITIRLLNIYIPELKRTVYAIEAGPENTGRAHRVGDMYAILDVGNPEAHSRKFQYVAIEIKGMKKEM